jgi:signal transduction histidine kinase/CheY-like chemotaxis protein
MSPLSAVAPVLLVRARADQVDTLYRQCHRTTVSMVLGAFILCAVLWQHVSPVLMAVWLAAILLNQTWRTLLARRYRRIPHPVTEARRWGIHWSVGSALAGGLWGVAAVVMYPASPAHEALLIVCLFGVVLGGLNLTAVYKPSFYGFVLPALVPLIVRVALQGDPVHVFTAIVMTVVLAFLLAFGHHLNDVLTHSLATRYENVDLIGELQAQTQAAVEARANAETANRAKSQFLAAASHDLRQPLHAMGLFAAALASKTREPELKPLVESIYASVEALEGLFGQLLDLSRLDAGALTPQRDTVVLQPMFARLAADFAPQMAAHGLRFRVVATRLAVDSDPILLERILRNLLANALRYTRSGAILLGARRRGDLVRIEVIDQGIGIAADMRERIFDEFVQGGAGPQHDASGRGLGLGLAIVRRLAALLEHRIDVDSAPGLGSRFSLAVPRVGVRRRREPPHAVAPARTAEPVAVTSFAGRCVAVIDDDPVVVAAMRALFSSWGATVGGGENAGSALAELRTLTKDGALAMPRFDLVVADLRLAQGRSGIDAVRELRQRSGSSAPALIVSGDTGEEARTSVSRAGFTLLSKPVVASKLQNAAAQALATARD